jgi:hypothetical protein
MFFPWLFLNIHLHGIQEDQGTLFLGKASELFQPELSCLIATSRSVFEICVIREQGVLTVALVV